MELNLPKHPVINRRTKRIVNEILDSGKLSGFKGKSDSLGGYWVQKLENAICEKFDVKYAINMNSATSCLHSAVLAVAPSSFIGVTPFSFSSSASCVLMGNSRPVFIDIDDGTFNMSPEALQSKSTGFISAVIPVHLMGNPCDLDRFPDIPIIEDAAQAIGARYKGKYVGTIGKCGIFSFNQSKQISCGEGGVLITNDDTIALMCKALRNHGEVSNPYLGMYGYNFRMNEIEAAIVYEQLKSLDDNIAYRAELADYMTEKLKDIPEIITPYVPLDNQPSWYTYGVKYKGEGRNQLQDELIKHGVYFGKDYCTPLYHLPVYNTQEDICPIAEKVSKEIMVFSWLRYPTKKRDIDKAVKILKKVLNDRNKSI